MRQACFTLLAGLVLLVPPADLQAQDPAPVSHQVVMTVEDGQIVLSLDPVMAIPRDRVIFSAPGADSFTIDFPEGTPFQNRTVTGSGQQQRNVPIPPGKVRDAPYKYDITIVMDGNTYRLDPEIVVRPRRGR